MIYRIIYVCIIYKVLVWFILDIQSNMYTVQKLIHSSNPTVVWDSDLRFEAKHCPNESRLSWVCGFVSTLLNVKLEQVLSDGSPQKPMVFLHLSCHDSTSQKKVPLHLSICVVGTTVVTTNHELIPLAGFQPKPGEKKWRQCVEMPKSMIVEISLPIWINNFRKKMFCNHCNCVIL